MNHNTVFRDGNGNLWLLKDTELLPYGMDDPVTQNILTRANLYGTGLNFSANEVHQFVTIILEETPELTAFDNWILSHANQVFYITGTPINIHPLMALRILQTFGFRKFVDNTRIMQIESVDHWLNNMPTVFTDIQLQNIIRNRNNHLLEYLENLVDFINGNPAILNRHINNYDTGLNLAQRRLHAP